MEETGRATILKNGYRSPHDRFFLYFFSLICQGYPLLYTIIIPAL
jgi:hypothetical protein